MNRYFALIGVTTTTPVQNHGNSASGTVSVPSQPGWYFITSGGSVSQLPVFYDRASLEAHVAAYYRRNGVNPETTQIVVGREVNLSVDVASTVGACS